MVDSMGSVSLNKDLLRALQSCALDSGFIRNANGDLNIYKARVQAIIFNAASKIFVNHNRRSHDKLLVADGHFPEITSVMTGGRNISLDYYGILRDGSYNPDTYRDAELFLRGGTGEDDADLGVGEVSEIYYTLLFLFKNNKNLQMSPCATRIRLIVTSDSCFARAMKSSPLCPRCASTLIACRTISRILWSMKQKTCCSGWMKIPTELSTSSPIQRSHPIAYLPRPSLI